MNTPTKVILGVVGGMFALFFVLRIFVLSSFGLPIGWVLLAALPIGAGILLTVLRLTNLGNLGNSSHFGGFGGFGGVGGAQNPGLQAPPMVAPPPAAGGVQAQPPAFTGGVQPQPPAFTPFVPPAPSTSQRLQELETLRATGAISDTDYNAKRQQIIAEM